VAAVTEVDELYVLARRVLLDALAALGNHREAVVLVGAQAVYLRVGEADLAVAPYTTDGDLVVDPSVLGGVPPLEQALMAADFTPKAKDSVGVWVTVRPTRDSGDAEIGIDLLVPSSVSPGKGRRAARLPGHDPRAARIVRGLDGALVDADVMNLGSLDGADSRWFEVRVAGPAALLVAKLHKIDDRRETGRQSDKDALDAFRLLRGTDTGDLAVRFRTLLDDSKSAEVAEAAVALLRAQFGTRRGVGIEMANRSAGPLADADEIAGSSLALANDLFEALKR
jgi:hypothetical protein